MYLWCASYGQEPQLWRNESAPEEGKAEARSNFNALFTEVRGNAFSDYLDYCTSTEESNSSVWIVSFRTKGLVQSGAPNQKDYDYQVRCIKDIN